MGVECCTGFVSGRVRRYREGPRPTEVGAESIVVPVGKEGGEDSIAAAFLTDRYRENLAVDDPIDLVDGSSEDIVTSSRVL